jgi:dipeptidyl-peptidase-4
VTFLRGRDDDQFQLDLWEFNLADKVTRRLVDSKKLKPVEQISDAEKARRERTRAASLRGILDYSWSPDGKKLLVPVAGDLFLVDVSSPDQAKLIASGDTMDAKVSPKGGFVSFVRGQNLFVYDLAASKERQLTRDGGGTIHNAEAEFVAQEEMGQTTGYWWSPGDTAIAFKRFDESQVAIARRFEIYADRTDVVEQRYPYAGEKNVRVSLAVVSTGSGVIRNIDLGANSDIYLVRADWAPDGKQVFYQKQSRDQKTLELIGVDATSLVQRVVLTETSNTWVNLHDDLRFLDKGSAFVWASERTGRKHLYLYDLSGKLINPITAGDWQIDNVLAVDQSLGKIYVESNFDNVIDKQIYALSLDGSTAGRPTRISKADGWHEGEFSRNGKLWIDEWSDRSNPPQVSVRLPNGEFVAWINQNALDDKHPYAPYLSAHLPTEFGTLKSRDGQTLHYSIIKPTGFAPGKRYPVFLAVYGGPGVQNVGRRWGGLFNQYMAQQGYVVFSLDNRGSSRRERKFTDALYRNLGKVEVEDQLTGIDWLAQQPFVDAKRIGVFGWSYGGFMTARLLAEASDRIAAGAVGAPVTDYTLYDTHYTERFMGDPKENVEGYKQSSVFTHLGGLKSPMLLLHGMADDNVLFTNSTKLISDLTSRGVLFELMTYPGQKHGFATRAARLHRDRTIEAFFAKYLKPDQ